MLPESPKESSTTKDTEANGRTIFLTPGTPHEWGKREIGDQPPAPICHSTLSIKADGLRVHLPYGYLFQARWPFIGANFVELRHETV
jgi:hypothetical protein